MKKHGINYTEYSWGKSKSTNYDYLISSVKKVFRDFKISKEAKILDTGCGNGYIISEINRIGYKDIWAFDLSKSGIDIAKNKFEQIKDRFIIHDVYDQILPHGFPENNYDLIISIEVIEHLYDPQRYMKNIYHWLKPGGILILSTPYHGYLKNTVISLANKFDQHVNPLWTGGHIKLFSKNTLYQLLKEKDLTPARFYGSGRLPFLWKSMCIVAKKK